MFPQHCTVRGETLVIGQSECLVQMEAAGESQIERGTGRRKWDLTLRSGRAVSKVLRGKSQWGGMPRVPYET
jgi:hypothetical protein